MTRLCLPQVDLHVVDFIVVYVVSAVTAMLKICCHICCVIVILTVCVFYSAANYLDTNMYIFSLIIWQLIVAFYA